MTTCPAGHETDGHRLLRRLRRRRCADAAPAGAPTPQPGDTGAVPCSTPTRPPSASAPPRARAGVPQLRHANPEDALFCEACGYDFTTGTLPRTRGPAADAGPPADDGSRRRHARGQHRRRRSRATLGGRGLDRPGLVRRPGQHRPAALGRPADRRTAEAHVDPDRPRLRAAATSTPTSTCGSDNGISRRHAQLTTDGNRWWVEDLGSSNGTYVGGSVGPLPDDPDRGRPEAGDRRRRPGLPRRLDPDRDPQGRPRRGHLTTGPRASTAAV